MPIENQVVEYDNPDGDYVKQYEQIPDERSCCQFCKNDMNKVEI